MFCKKNHGESRELYLGAEPLLSRLGIKPCFSTLPKALMCSLASSNRPVHRNKPRREMKTSRPQHLAQDTEKWGKPAASDGTRFSGHSDADLTNPVCWILTRARL